MGVVEALIFLVVIVLVDMVTRSVIIEAIPIILSLIIR